ncbi:papain-like cysteine protease family protein [Duganella sp. Dugasp56]|uniref:papain-like cysteine protease family protein n=1 Tax=Duganella sp. Dugasp56 TaxID=3243046 RepID=UPI00159DFF41
MSHDSITFQNLLELPAKPVTFHVQEEGAPSEKMSIPLHAVVIHQVNPKKGPWKVWAVVEGLDLDMVASETGVRTISAAELPAKLTIRAGRIIGALSGAGNPDGDQRTDDDDGRHDGGHGDHGLEAERKLAFAIQTQLQSKWCWAAVTTSVALFYQPKSAVSQCKLATWRCNDEHDCCTAPLPEGCNHTYNTGQALAHVGHLQASTQGALPLATLKSQIDDDQPVGASVKWSSGRGNHAMVIYGYKDDSIWIADPGRRGGVTYMKYADYPASYKSGGTWARTYTTKSA